MPNDIWKYNGLIRPRVARLQAAGNFEQLAECILSEMSNLSYDREDGVHAAKGCWRPVFRFSLTEYTHDWFFNARTGYRGQFWTNAQCGIQKNQELLTKIAPKLLAAAPREQNTSEAIRASLSSKHAKIWIDECESLDTDDSNLVIELNVEPWVTTASKAHRRYVSGDRTQAKLLERIWGVRTLVGTHLVVMGDWLRLNDNAVQGPVESKLNRSEEIHSYGFT